MLFKIFISILIAGVLLVMLWMLRGVMLMPLRPGKNERLSVVITICGSAPELENTVDSLLWLNQNGTLPAEIVVRNAGMDEETAHTAEILQKKGIIKLIN